MQRFLKVTALLFLLMLIFSLTGCSTSTNTSMGKQEKKTESTHAAAGQETVPKTDQKMKQDQPKETTTSSSEVKDKVKSQAQTTNTQDMKKAVVNSTNNQTNSKVSAGNKPAVAEKKPTAAPSNPTTTSTPPKTSPTTVSPKPAATVTLSIVGPKGTIMAASKVNINTGETILDVLLQVTKKQNIQVDYRGSGATAYVEGIDNIYEFDYGAKSGWTVKQNGSTIPKSAGVITVKSGDSIQWIYTQ